MGPAEPSTRVVVVGLGRAGAFAIGALGRSQPVEIVAGVDPKGGSATAAIPHLPVYRSLRELPRHLDPDVVVVATPTASHVETCLEILDRMPKPRSILCEKPLSASYPEARALFRHAAQVGVGLQILYHYAFSPEVMWAHARWPLIERQRGPVTGFVAQFDDPKADLTRASQILLTSWVDAGINAMSVLARFVPLREVLHATRGAPKSCAGTVTFTSCGAVGTGSIRTDWGAARAHKVTELRFRDGSALTLDHVAGTAHLPDDDASPSYTSNETDAPAGRYRAMLSAYLAGDPSVFDTGVSLHLHELLSVGAEHNRIAPDET